MFSQLNRATSRSDISVTWSTIGDLDYYPGQLVIRMALSEYAAYLSSENFTNLSLAVSIYCNMMLNGGMTLHILVIHSNFYSQNSYKIMSGLQHNFLFIVSLAYINSHDLTYFLVPHACNSCLNLCNSCF